MKSRLLVLVSTILLVTVTGCGARPLSELYQQQNGGALVAEPAPDSERAAEIINTIQPDQEIAAKLPGEVRSRGMNFSSSVGYPPMEMWADDGTTPIGIDIALGRAIARVLGVKMNFTDEDFNAQIPGLMTKRYDMVMTSLSDTKEREQKVSFVDYVQAGAGFLVAQGNPQGITGPDQLCGKTVSVVDNGSSLILAQKYAAACVKKGAAKINILRFTGDQDALLALRSGRAQANITDYVVAAYKASDPSQKAEAVNLDGTESPWGIAMNPDRKQLIAAVKAALQKLIDDGAYSKILASYNMQKIAVDKVVVNGAKS